MGFYFSHLFLASWFDAVFCLSMLGLLTALVTLIIIAASERH